MMNRQAFLGRLVAAFAHVSLVACGKIVPSNSAAMARSAESANRSPAFGSAFVAPTASPIPPTATTLPPTPTPAPPRKTGMAAAPRVSGVSVAVIDGDSGALLYGLDPHRRLAPASVTKIVTALVALRYGSPRQQISVQFDPAQLPDSTLMGIHPGETYTLEDLLYGLILPSGNDAALAIANAIGGSDEHFVAMMNAEVTDLGLHDCHFVNPHGLDAPDHYSSAYDLAMAARYGMRHDPEFRKVVGTETWEVHGTRSFPIDNLNRFLGNYPGADGVKIGFTDDAGRTIVASATRHGHQVFVAVMKVGDWVSNTAPLFDWVYQNFAW
jgi:serine-type D-Ala-D-Ala carboxypeptidase (penicillin-binding protein 5/6)